MDGLKQLKSGFETDCHALLNAVADAIAKEFRERAQLELPPPTGKTQSGTELKVQVVYQGPATEESREKAREVLQRAGNAAEMIRLLKQVGLG